MRSGRRRRRRRRGGERRVGWRGWSFASLRRRMRGLMGSGCRTFYLSEDPLDGRRSRAKEV